MKKLLAISALILVLVLAACGGSSEEGNNGESEGQDSSEQTDENSSSEGSSEDAEKGEIVIGQTSWSSTAPPTQIAKSILEEVGYEVEVTLLDQPVIWESMANEEIHFFMDAWLPYTEEALWSDYKDELQKVSTSYEEVPLGWVVPEYVDAETIGDLEGRGEEFDGEILTIGEGAGIVELSKEVMNDENYNLDGFELKPSSEAAMLGVVDQKMKDEEPFVFTGWRPHSVFAKHDLKFLEDTEGHFQYDNVYVLSYQGIQDQPQYSEAYDILSNWEISVDELESMIQKAENEDASYEDLAQQWIEDNRDTVDEWINN
ncbi:glycine betaine ABC transporter substrate-binding protein [Alkalibacillus almallahensis]|uniref:glycine betaine ABC transporter substrate-binding protein n=1 Tax=Alkalibacillus almallahensis TaxID=1379154 RepID=UPI00141F7AEA|nr:glycine betaine ABC transporter substrate-binding protein [Alkalibacillus almallahensis]NIK11374.1 glycine betaine/proline transport system substrate-binding protein [Alkalibacillus almallahensis]